MLGERILDPDGVESREPEVAGLGLLPVVTRVRARQGDRAGAAAPRRRRAAARRGRRPTLAGYEIHCGRVDRARGARPFGVVVRRGERAVDEPEGAIAGSVAGTLVHGLFEDAAVRAALGAGAAGRRARSLRGARRSLRGRARHAPPRRAGGPVSRPGATSATRRAAPSTTSSRKRRDIRHFRAGAPLADEVLAPHPRRRAPGAVGGLLAAVGLRRGARSRAARAHPRELLARARGRGGALPRRRAARAVPRLQARGHPRLGAEPVRHRRSAPGRRGGARAPPRSPSRCAGAPAARCRTCGWRRAPRASASAGSASSSRRCCGASWGCRRASSRSPTSASAIPIEFRDRPLLEETGWRAASSRRRGDPSRAAIAAPPTAARADRRRRPRHHETPSRRRRQPPSAIPPFDAPPRPPRAPHQERLCKPRGSLGRLESLAALYAGARGQFPVAPPRQIELFVFAADHGVVEEGVSA